MNSVRSKRVLSECTEKESETSFELAGQTAANVRSNTDNMAGGGVNLYSISIPTDYRVLNGKNPHDSVSF